MQDSICQDTFAVTIRDLSDFLVSDKHSLYNIDFTSLACLSALLWTESSLIKPLSLPSKVSDKASRLNCRVRGPSHFSDRMAQWALNKNKTIHAEWHVPSYGVADLIDEKNKIIIECGDTRTDKPMAAMALGYKIAVQPFQKGLDLTHNLSGVECDALLFEADEESVGFKWMRENYEYIRHLYAVDRVPAKDIAKFVYGIFTELTEEISNSKTRSSPDDKITNRYARLLKEEANALVNRVGKKIRNEEQLNDD